MKAVEYFMQGSSCSESIVQESIEKGLVPKELLSCATPFSGGMGSGCLCGAISGSQLVLGYLYGKNNVKGNEVLARNKAKQLIEEFKKRHKVTCCRALTAGLDMASGERKQHCQNMVNTCSDILSQLVEGKEQINK